MLKTNTTPCSAATPLLSEQAPLISQEKEYQRKRFQSPGKAEDTPAYRILQDNDLLDTRFRKDCFEDIFCDKDLIADATSQDIMFRRLRWGVYWTPGCGWILYSLVNKEVTVPPGHVCCFINGDNDYIFAQPGNHCIRDPFLMQVGLPVSTQRTITHGNRSIVTVPQGQLGIAMDMGQPVLLPPGLHSWISETMQFQRIVSLDEHVITIGPYTILTVDEGYAAVTQNNGLQVVLDGGQTHLLTHQKWKFEKFISLKIQTDDLEQIMAASADNVIMSVNSTVVWKIKNVRVAATMAAETMAKPGSGEVAADITKLRRDVLKQAIASLASFIGSVNYSDSFHVAAAAQRNLETAHAVAVDAQQTGQNEGNDRSMDNPIFDSEGMSEAVTHANQITSTFGVEIISINIISANPVDDNLTASLATGAVASAEALQAETAARGRAKAMKIEAEASAIKRKIEADSKAEASLIQANADAESDKIHAEGAKAAEILRAEGSKKAAELLESSKTAISLETMKTAATAIKPSDKFFFAQEPQFMPNILNPSNMM